LWIVVGQLQSLLAALLRQASLEVGLEAPDDLLDEPGAVVGVGDLAKYLRVTVTQLRYGEALQEGDLACDVQGHNSSIRESGGCQLEWTLSLESP
jgi:hypothetical protein